MRADILAALLVLVCAAPFTAADEAPSEPLRWPHLGCSAISKAAQEAKAGDKRILLGLSGSPT